MLEAYNFITGQSIILWFIAFLILSYLIEALFTWSFIKPLKYLGIPIIIVGIVSLILKVILMLGVDTLFKDKLAFIKPFFDNSENLFIKYGIICIAVGIVMIIIYVIINKILKSKASDNEKPKDKQQISE